MNEKDLQEIVEDMQEHGLSKKHKQDAVIWKTVSDSFFNKWGGDPRNFLQDCKSDA